MRMLLIAFVLSTIVASCGRDTSVDPIPQPKPVGELTSNQLNAEYVVTPNLQIWDRYHTDRVAITYDNHTLTIHSQLRVEGTVTSSDITYIYGLDGKRYAFDGKAWIEH